MVCAARAFAQQVPLTNALKLESATLIGARPSTGPLIPVIGDGRAHLAYELYLTNYGKKPVHVVSLNVHSANGAAFATTIERDALKSAFTPAAPPSRLTGYDSLLAPGASGVLYVFLDFLIDGIHIFGLALLSMKTATATYEMSWVGKVASSVSAPLTRLYDSSYRF